MAFGGAFRSAITAGTAAEARNPVGHSSCTSWSPVQKEPNDIQGVPFSSSAMPGSIALNRSPLEEITSPRSTHSYAGSAGSSVVLVASAITDRFLPNVDAE